MMSSSPPPSRGDKPHYCFEKLRKGSKVKGWLCGPYFGCRTHYLGASKPCRSAMTNGQLSCICSVKPMKEEWTGYVPFFDVMGRQCVVAFGRDMERSVSSITYGAPILILKAGWDKAPTVIRSEEWSETPCPYLGALKIPHDIRRWLLILWKDPELEAALGADLGPIPNIKVEQPATKNRTAKAEEALKMKLALRSGILAGKPLDLDELTTDKPSTVDKPTRNGKPSTNGTH